VTHGLNAMRTLELAPLVYCDERRPTCLRCKTAGRGRCVYPRSEEAGVTTLREQLLHYQLDCRTRDLRVILYLLRVLRHAGDEEATAALARLRLSTEVSRLIAAVRGGNTADLTSHLGDPFSSCDLGSFAALSQIPFFHRHAPPDAMQQSPPVPTSSAELDYEGPEDSENSGESARFLS